MARRSYEDFLRKQHPGIDDVAKFYADLGVADPIQWAASELKGEKNVVALALFCHALRREVLPQNDGQWQDLLAAGDLNVDNPEVVAEASDAMAKLKESGVDLRLITPLIRVFQAQVVKNVVALLDGGASVAWVAAPEGREVSWELVAVDDDGNEVGSLSGLHDELDDL